MKKLISTAIFFSFFIGGYAQIDTISQNIYQLDGRMGIGKVNYGGYFNPALLVYNGWLQISDSSDHDAGLIVSHLNKYGYGFARTLHAVYEGVNGDPFTEFRIRNTADDNTVTSWSIGANNAENDKLVISNAINTNTGASPRIGEKLVTIRTTGELGIGTSEPNAKLEVANGDIFISDIEKGIIMKSPDGQCWRGKVDNFGALSFTVIDCPIILSVSVQELRTSEKILLYPNPTENKISIVIKDNNINELNFSFYDLQGKMLESGKLESNFEILDISKYTKGAYILTVSDRQGEVISSSKVIKK